MTPLNEIPKEAEQPEQPGIDCEAVKTEWEIVSKTGRVSNELMEKALQCNLVPKDKVKGIPGEAPPLSREENPLVGEDMEDKELGMAELVMAEDDWYDPLEGLTPGGSTYNPNGYENLVEEGLADNGYTLDENGNWNYSGTDGEPSGETSPFDTSFVGKGLGYSMPKTGTPPETIQSINYNGLTVYQYPIGNNITPVRLPDGQGGFIEGFIDPSTSSEWLGRYTDRGGAGGAGRISNVLNPNYFSGNAPQKPAGMGNMEWHYKYGGGMYNNAFNPENFYYNPDDKTGGTSTPYTRLGNRGNLTPEVVKSNRPFYDERSMDRFRNQDELKYKMRLGEFAEPMTALSDVPTGANVDTGQGQAQEVDAQVQEQIKEALSKAGFNLVDIEMSPDGKIFITVGQFEDSYIENAQYFEVDFELAEPSVCGRRFKAIAVTPGMYQAKDGTPIELSSADMQNIAGLFRNKPLVLVDHELARPDSTHEGRTVGYVVESYYDPNYDAVIYKGALNEDIDLATIAGSSIKLSHGKTPMGRHIALIPKCVTGRACYAPQDPNAVILENAQNIKR